MSEIRPRTLTVIIPNLSIYMDSYVNKNSNKTFVFGWKIGQIETCLTIFSLQFAVLLSMSKSIISLQCLWARTNHYHSPYSAVYLREMLHRCFCNIFARVGPRRFTRRPWVFLPSRRLFVSSFIGFPNKTQHVWNMTL